MYSEIINMLRDKACKNGIPIRGMYELTSRCNLKCKFCYVCDRENTKPLTEKSTLEWIDMIKQAVELGMLECTFTGGEPFIRDDFEEIYCKAYDMGLRICIYTNATLIGDKQISFLLKRKPDFISTTIYGASAESYNTICGDGKYYEIVMTTLEKLKKSDFPFEIKTIGIMPLMHEYESIGKIAAQYKCNQKIDIYIAPGRDDPSRLMCEWRIPTSKMMDAINAYHKARNKVISLSVERRKNAIPCRAGLTDFVITYDGRLLGCPQLTCFETLPFKVGFDKAWNLLKQQVRNAKACDECVICDDFDGCYQCPAIRLKETGTITKCSTYLHELAHALK